MNKYVYLNKNSLSKEFCLDIINLFENEDDGKYHGVTHSGLNKNIKDTTDFAINMSNEKWAKYNKFLQEELNRNIKKYLKNLRDEFKNKVQQSDWNYFDDNGISFNTILMQKYKKGTGKYIFHHDFSIDYQNKKYRAFTFLWYLNTIELGGETEFEEFKIKPETGKLLIFPASWTFPHSGKIPISDDKYIITGWAYINFS
jgi:hypothetical protein